MTTNSNDVGWGNCSDFPVCLCGVTRFIGKLAQKITELENLHSSINEVYSSGAVEGYSAAKLSQYIQPFVCCHGSTSVAIPKTGLGMKLLFGTSTSRLRNRGLDLNTANAAYSTYVERN